jgi:Glycosyl transferase family 2/Glycosyl transferases group 1
MAPVPELAVVSSPGQDWFVRELVETVRYELELQGIPSTLHPEGFPEPREGLVYALAAPRQFVALEGEDALPDEAILKRTVFICAEPPARAGHEEHVDLVRRAGAVFDIDVRSVQELHRAGVPARTLRPGYSRLRDRFDPDADRSIDVAFLGTYSERRARVLSRCAPILSRHNCLIQLVDSEYANAAGSTSFIAESKYDLLARTRVVINLHRDDAPYVEWLRALEAMHCGAVVVSEHASGLAPFEPGEHLIVAGPESLPFVVEAVLRDRELQQRVRERAYERLSSWLPFALSIGVLRAALVELVGNPIPAGASRGRGCLSGHEPAGRWDPVDAEPEPAVRQLRNELDRAQGQLIEVQRQLSRVQRALLSRDGATALRLCDETPAWGARRTPKVSVLIALHDDASGLAATLDSIAASWIKDLELIIVDAASSDDSLAVAAAWLRAHRRVPARLLVDEVDPRRTAARNLALAQARAPYCLVMDPSDDLSPRGLDVLAGTLEAMPDVAFVYPIVSLEGATGSAYGMGEALAGFFGWDPRRLRLGNYMRSPYLIRTDRLRGVGAFADDARRPGDEDYELWCRIAERGWRGQLVPQTLAAVRPPRTA